MTDNPFTQPLRKTMNDPQFDWVRPQRMRRRMVMLFLALVIAQPILLVATGSPLSLRAHPAAVHLRDGLAQCEHPGNDGTACARSR
jgi:hypothetical protein